MFFFLLKRLTEDLKRPPDTLEDLKFVLRVIADIRDKSLEVELRYVDLQERYRTLLMYDIEVRRQTSPRTLEMGTVSYQPSEWELFLITPFRHSSQSLPLRAPTYVYGVALFWQVIFCSNSLLTNVKTALARHV